MKNLHWLIVLGLFIFACNPDDALIPEAPTNPNIESRDVIVQAINDKASSITSSDPTANFSELAVLDQLANTRFVGMGEASHGTKEFFEMKHKILKYYVENHNYRGIIMEADFGECIKANEYILHDRGDINTVMQEMHFWVWRTAEVRSMIQWMHDFNLNKPLEERVYYLGSDCQFTDDNLTLVEEKIEGLSDATKNSIGQYALKLEKNFSLITDFNLYTLDSMLLYADSLILEIESHESEISSTFSEREYQIIKQLATVAKQAYQVVKAYFFNDNFNYRDKYMADNTIWWADQIGTDHKFLLWAHNYHVSKIEVDSEYGGSQGGHLAERLGEDYKVIGFSMAVGSINAVYSTGQGGLAAGPLPNTPEFGSINELFYLAEKDNFIWVFDEATRNEPLFSWFDSWRDWMQVGSRHPNPDSYYTSIKLFDEFDTVIHFNNSSPTQLVQ